MGDTGLVVASGIAPGPNGMVAVTGSAGSVVYWETLPPVAIACLDTTLPLLAWRADSCDCRREAAA